MLSKWAMHRCPRCSVTMKRGTFWFHRCPGLPVTPLLRVSDRSLDFDETPRSRPLAQIITFPKKPAQAWNGVVVALAWVGGLLFLLAAALTLGAGEYARGGAELLAAGLCLALALVRLPGG